MKTHVDKTLTTIVAISFSLIYMSFGVFSSCIKDSTEVFEGEKPSVKVEYASSWDLQPTPYYELSEEELDSLHKACMSNRDEVMKWKDDNVKYFITRNIVFSLCAILSLIAIMALVMLLLMEKIKKETKKKSRNES